MLNLDLKWTAALTAAVGLALGCGATAEDGAPADSALGGDGAGAGACTVFSAQKQRNLTPGELAALKDPIAQKLLLGDGCPATLDEITAKFAKTDGDQCTDRVAGRPDRAHGVSTHVVNDSAFLTGAPGGTYRGVMTRDCDSRDESELFVSMFGLDPEAAQLPQEQTEVIGFDKTTGVFDFYVREGAQNQWVFMGSSADAIAQGYACDESGACIPRAAKTARCWACHESGGVNMKEIHSPWNSWNIAPGAAMPGHDALFEKFAQELGAPDVGASLEDRIENGNFTWGEKRIELLKPQGAAEVLRPLFCTLTVNLDQGPTAGKALRAIPGRFLGHDDDTVGIDPSDYAALLVQNNQRIEGEKGPLRDKSGAVVRDTQTAFRYPAKGQIDRDYIDQLTQHHIVDEDFVADVRAVDFTRPVFSKARCDLLAFAPELAAADLTPEKIREGFIAKLKSAGSSALSPPAAKLLQGLEAPNDGAAHEKEASDFLAACKARPGRDFVADVLRVLSHQRRALLAHKGTEGAGAGQGIIEFTETLPVDDLPDTAKAFAPATCTLE